MKKHIFALALGLTLVAQAVQGQVILFDQLKSSPIQGLGSRDLTFFSATNYNHRLANYVISPTRTDLRFQVSNGNMSFTNVMSITSTGRVGIGTTFDNVTAPDFNEYRLFVTGGIRAEKVKIDLALAAGWADHVFEPTFRLRPLTEVEQFIKEHKHLPDVPSAEELVKKGIDVAEMQKIQMQKIEELTLYILELKKEIEALKAQK